MSEFKVSFEKNYKKENKMELPKSNKESLVINLDKERKEMKKCIVMMGVCMNSLIQGHEDALAGADDADVLIYHATAFEGVLNEPIIKKYFKKGTVNELEIN